MRNFYNLEIWNISYALVLKIYKITEKFPKEETNNITSQIKRAAISIPLNIAEGSTRFTKRAYLQFLNYSYGSSREVEVLLLLCRDLNYITQEEFKLLFEEIDKLSKKLYKFINVVDKSTFYK
ncbi:four helix bundle protein [Candidatus Woesearchaeota archaeon]|nr:four helix bundle protein [Candidatus Woesearchaeota archaeon]